eukprot:m51a1_g2032 hypothetical protein (1112) ;mRNA; r:1328733-1333365
MPSVSDPTGPDDSSQQVPLSWGWLLLRYHMLGNAVGADLNGDGFSDVVVVAWAVEWAPSYQYQAAHQVAAYVLFGGRSGIVGRISDIDGTNGFAIVGMSSDCSTQGRLTAGDFNKDGIDDVAVSCGSMWGGHSTSVVFGRHWTGATTLEAQSQGLGLGEFMAYGAGDVNGDRVDDVVGLQGGMLAIAFGNTTGALSVQSGSMWLSYSVSSVDVIGDFNGDAFDDIATAYGSRTVLVLGQSQWDSPWNTPTLMVVTSDAQEVEISGLGDVNNDGLTDLGIATTSKNPGRAYIVFGRNHSLPSSISLSDLVLGANATALSLHDLNTSVTDIRSAGDVNGDSVTDIAISGSQWTSYLVFGRSSWENAVNITGLKGSDGFRLRKYPTDIGFSSVDNTTVQAELRGVGDVNGDGIVDLAMTVLYYSTTSQMSSFLYILYGNRHQWPWFVIDIDSLESISGQSKAYVVFGRSNATNVNVRLWNYQSTEATYLSEWDDTELLQVLGVGDMNGDDIGDAVATMMSQHWTLGLVLFGDLAPSISDLSGLSTTAYVGKQFNVTLPWDLIVDSDNVSLTDLSIIENSTCHIGAIAVHTPALYVSVSVRISGVSGGRVLSSTLKSFNSGDHISANNISIADANLLLSALVADPPLGFSGIMRVSVGVTDMYDQALSGVITIQVKENSSAVDKISTTNSKLGVTLGASLGAFGFVAVCAVAGTIAYAVYHRRILANIETSHVHSWGFDPKLRPSIREDIHGYKLIRAGELDFKRVLEAYERCPVPGMDVAQVEIVYSPTLENLFEARVQQLQQRSTQTVFRPNWPAADAIETSVRKPIAERVQEMTGKYHDAKYPDVNLLLMWHGTRPKTLPSLFCTGFANLASTDDGFFGKGLYNAVEAQYAYDVYFRGALLLNWVSFYSAFPVIESDMDVLRGKGNFENYDAHFAPVRPDDPRDENEVNYWACMDLSQARYHELVVFEASQCLPRYLVTLQPALPKQLTMDGAAAIASQQQRPAADTEGDGGSSGNAAPQPDELPQRPRTEEEDLLKRGRDKWSAPARRDALAAVQRAAPTSSQESAEEEDSVPELPGVIQPERSSLPSRPAAQRRSMERTEQSRRRNPQGR